MIKNKLDSIKWKYLAVMATLFLIMISFRIYYDIRHHRDLLDEKIIYLIKDVNQKFNESINAMRNKYIAVSHHYMNDSHINELVIDRKRQELHKCLTKDYNTFKQLDPYLYVMHFFPPY